ncbi:MAG: hypothetical protein WD023_06420 [Ilumatobacteraceae bacterium]
MPSFVKILLGAVTSLVVVGGIIASSPEGDPFDLPVTLITPTTVEVRSMAAVPAQATMRVVVAAADPAALDPVIGRLGLLGYWDARVGVTTQTEDAIYYREGFALEANNVMADLGLRVVPQPLVATVSDADASGDVVIVVTVP